MKLAIKKVPGIKEPIARIASKGFAIGKLTNQVYTWTTTQIVETSQDEDENGVERQNGQMLHISKAVKIEFKDELPDSQIVEILSHINQTAFLTEGGDVFTIDHNPQKNMVAQKAVKMKFLNRIIKIASGSYHFLALKKVYRPAFKDWTTEMLQKFVVDIGFEDFENIIRNMKLTGAQLEKADRQFVKDNFGLNGISEWK